VPAAEARVQRRADGVDPVRPGARRRRVGGAPGLGRGEGPDPGAAVDVLLPADLLLLLPRQARHRGDRDRGRGQRDLRDRLSARRLDLAGDEEGGPGARGRPARRRGLQAAAGERDPHAGTALRVAAGAPEKWARMKVCMKVCMKVWWKVSIDAG